MRAPAVPFSNLGWSQKKRVRVMRYAACQSGSLNPNWRCAPDCDHFNGMQSPTMAIATPLSGYGPSISNSPTSSTFKMSTQGRATLRMRENRWPGRSRKKAHKNAGMMME